MLPRLYLRELAGVIERSSLFDHLLFVWAAGSLLFQVECGNINETHSHEVSTVRKTAASLRGPIQHYCYVHESNIHGLEMETFMLRNREAEY